MLRPGDPAPDLPLVPVFGLPAAGDRPWAVCFVGPLGLPTGRAALAQMMEVFPSFDAAGMGLVAVCEAPLAAARDYVPRHHLLFPVVLDPDRALAAAWGLPPAGWAAALPRLEGGRPSFRALELGFGRGLLRPHHAGAAFGVGADRRVRHALYRRSLWEPLPLEVLLEG